MPIRICALLKLIRPILLIFGLFVQGVFLIFSGDLSAQQHSLDSNRAKYEQARQAFDTFEREHGNYVETKNTKVHFLTWGNPKDIPFVWIHGSFTNSYEIKDLADSIVQNGYYLIAIDYYGHGLTPIPSHQVSLYDVADDILHILNDLGIDQAVIGGWSRGAYIATAFYDSYPDRVKALILEDGGSVNINTHYHNLSENEIRKLTDELFSERPAYTAFKTEFEAFLEYRDKSDSSLQFELLAWIAQDAEGNYSIGPGIEDLFHMKDQEQFLMNIYEPSNTPLFARSMAMMDPIKIYDQLNVPLLILDPVTEEDLFPFEEENRALRNMHPDLIVHHIYENTGHNIHYERPEVFLRDVLSFLISLN